MVGLWHWSFPFGKLDFPPYTDCAMVNLWGIEVRLMDSQSWLIVDHWAVGQWPMEQQQLATLNRCK
jgi:hypothetical protein